MQARDVGERFLDAPVDLRLGKRAQEITDDGQVVHDVAERGGLDQQKMHSR